MADICGRWDLVVGEGATTFPSWVELKADGGAFVGQVGSARPLGLVAFAGETVKFGLPPQYERRKSDLAFEGVLVGDVLKGMCLADDGGLLPWIGKRAPLLPSTDFSNTSVKPALSAYSSMR